jgi:hypothetical protein
VLEGAAGGELNLATPFVMKWNQSSRRTPRLVVSFSGLDGAGKTRQIDTLVPNLERRGRTEVRWVPFKMWPEPLMTRLPVSFRRSARPEQESGTATIADENARHGLAADGSALLQRLARTPIGLAAAISAGVSLRRRAAGSSAELVVLDAIASTASSS